MKRRPIRTAILVVITALVWFLAVKVNFPAETPAHGRDNARHLPHIDVGPGTITVASEDPAYTFTVPTGFAVQPDTGDLVPVSWLPVDARITHHAATVPVDTDELTDAELASSEEANPEGTPAKVIETFEVGDFRVVVTEYGHTYTAYHDRTVVEFAAQPPWEQTYVYDRGVFPAAMRAILDGLTFG
ncbi:hypothetical protein [Phytomonospora endophytica]|uniref:Uncharacterized protein n=1 Tax=Phytomonospora endophytica TaxID=714109 RepID=A0A841FTM0_9ACTN|nr:hypothetical protein [Phytomonospora endophytica]MBB6036677.1 hypothetical protein [Phytomonospora endophytica]GIG65999.1 hypothetical protein Pen01_22940 [Phytomonospora endophytica]